MTSQPRGIRELSAREREVLTRALALADFEGRGELQAQAVHVAVVGGQPLALDLAVLAEIAPAPTPSGPIPTRAVASDPDGTLIGEVIVWVTEGYLSGLEYAWFTDEPPESLPDPQQFARG